MCEPFIIIWIWMNNMDDKCVHKLVYGFGFAAWSLNSKWWFFFRQSSWFIQIHVIFSGWPWWLAKWENLFFLKTSCSLLELQFVKSVVLGQSNCLLLSPRRFIGESHPQFILRINHIRFIVLKSCIIIHPASQSYKFSLYSLNPIVIIYYIL